MGKGFNRLAIGGLAVGTASVALGGVAQAAVQFLPVSATEDGYRWLVSNYAINGCFASGLGIGGRDHGFLSTTLVETGASQLASPFAKEFQGGGGLLSAGGFGGFYRQPGFIPQVEVKTDSAGNTKVKAKSNQTGFFDNIKHKVKFAFLQDDTAPSSGTVRAQFIFKNNGTSDDLLAFGMSSLADGGTLAATEDGVGGVTGADSWFVQSDGAPSAVTWGRGDGWVGGAEGFGAPDYPGTDNGCGTNHYGDARPEVILSPGEKVQILVFARVSPTPQTAIQEAGDFNGPGLPEALVSGLGANARAKVVNWNL
jgi:hypothetical protein